MFNPNFPAVPTSNEIYNLLIARYIDKNEPRIKFSDLHLRTYESKFSMKDTVEFLDSQRYQPRKDLESLRLELPIKWDMSPYGDRNWCLHLNSLRFLDRYFINFEKKSDVLFLKMPFRVIVDYALFHVGKLGYIKKHYFLLDDMTCGIRQVRLSYFLDKYMARLYDIEDDLTLRKISSLVHFQWKILADENNFKSTNHTISLLHALMSLIQIFDIENVDLWKKAICCCFDHLVQSQFDLRGIHTENSPEYHFFALKLLNELVKSGWYGDASEITKTTLALAEEMGSWMRYPDGRVLPIGDSSGKPPVLDINHWSNLSGGVDWSKNLECLVHPLYLMIKKIHRNRWTFFAMKSGHLIETHRHRDDLSYIWSEDGLDIVIDSGKYAYTKNIYRAFIKSQQAHNTITFSKKSGKLRKFFDFELGSSSPCITSFTHGKHIRHSKKILDTEIVLIRNVYFKPKSWLVVIDHILGAEKNIDFSSNIHFAPEFIWDKENPLLLQHRNNCNVSLQISYCSNIPLSYFSSQGGDLENDMNGFISREYRRVEPCPYIQLSGVGNAVVAVALNLSGQPIELELAENGCFLTYLDEKILLKYS